jgi:hypothetical protein
MQQTYSYVYRLDHISNSSFYIGYKKSSRPPFDDGYLSSSSYVKKIGTQNFSKTIIAVFFHHDDAYAYEQQLIWENLKDPNLLNKQYSRGGISRAIAPMSPETRKRISDLAKRRTCSEETREKLSKSTSGSSNPMFEKTHSPETKLRISRLNKPHSEETKQRMREARSNGKNYNIKSWKLQLPSGQIVFIEDLKTYCVENNLIYNSLMSKRKISRGPMKDYLLIES